MSVILPRLSARLVHDNKLSPQEKTGQNVELGERLCEFSAGGCEFSGWAIENVRRTCLDQKERLKFQRERLTTLRQKLSAQRGKLREEEAETPAQLSD